VAAGPRILLDANILIRAVLGRRVKKIITAYAEHAEFFAPERAYDEAERHLPDILAKHSRADQIEEVLAYLGRLRAVVLPVPDEVCESQRAAALSRRRDRPAAVGLRRRRSTTPCTDDVAPTLFDQRVI
jgi:predicted nucleic acid-binding protein